jgi:predicted PhzF superfamily epimerase YddE/YHI9
MKNKMSTKVREYMNDVQRKKFDSLCERWSTYKTLEQTDFARLELLACCQVELEKLQSFINENSPTYVVRAKSGDYFTRARPEYQQLQELRQRVGVLIDRLQQNATTTDEFEFVAD